MTINEYKAALKNIIDATDDEAILKQWKTHLERAFEQHRQQASGQPQHASSTETAPNKNSDDTTGYVVLESGLGIDE